MGGMTATLMAIPIPLDALVHPATLQSLMSGKLTRRDALKLGTSAAISAATPLFASAAESSQSKSPASQVPVADSFDELVFMRAVDLVKAIRQKKVSSREVIQ